MTSDNAHSHSAPTPQDYWSERLRAIAAEWAADPSYARANAAWQDGQEAPGQVNGFVSLRCAILRNATVEPWLCELYVALLDRGVKADFHLGDFDVYERYATNPGDFGDPEPDCVFVYLDAEALAGDARHNPPSDLRDALIVRVRTIVEGLLALTGANVVVSNLAPGPLAQHRLYGDQNPDAWSQQRRAVNLSLVREFADQHRVAILDVARIASEFGLARAYDQRMNMVARSPFAVDFLPNLAHAFADVLATMYLPPKKCLALDCDNTLWGGVLGEDGPAGVAIGPDHPGRAYREFQQFLVGLRRQGVLLALNSKNNETDVLPFMADWPEMILRPSDVAAHRINWRDKAANLKELADELNLGLDSMIFIDDSPFECARVSDALPEVQVEQFPANPLEINDFMASLHGVQRLQIGNADLVRSESMRANARREELRRDAPDFETFLKSLRIELDIARQDAAAAPRVSQLSQRTNQFNLTTRRYGVGDVERLMSAGQVYTLAMKDRFSDYGIVGAAIVKSVREGVQEVDSFMLSCRAFGRKVEEALLGALIADQAHSGHRVLLATYRATPRNGMTRDFYSSQGFSVNERSDEIAKFELDLVARRNQPPEHPYMVRKRGFPA